MSGQIDIGGGNFNSSRRLACRLYRESHREIIRERQRIYREANRELIKERNKKYNFKAREKRRQYRLSHPRPESAARWRTRNRDVIRATRRRYYHNNLDKFRAIGKEATDKRRAIKKNTAVGDGNIMLRIYKRAQKLRRWFDVCVDHIIPLSRGGGHVPENLQIIYRTDNQLKSNSLGYKPCVVFS